MPDLLEAAELACRAYFDGEAKTKLSIQTCMRELRAVVQAEKKQRSSDTTRIIAARKGQDDTR